MTRLLEARYVRDFVIWLRFSDGTQGEVDPAGELAGPIFEPLRDLAPRRFTPDPSIHTITWPNSVDLAPESRNHKVRVPA